MATFYLIKTVSVGATKVFAGDLINDAVDDANAIRSAGGLLWSSSDPTIAAAALKATNARLNKGADEAAIDAIMQQAVDAIQQQIGPDQEALNRPGPIATWRINATTGNDSNTGAVGAPLKTFAELNRRWGAGGVLNPGAGASVLVQLETDLPVTDPITFDVRLGPGVSILVQGLNTTTLYSGTFSAVTAKNRATNVPLSGTDAGITGGVWTAFLPAGATPGRVHDTTNDSYFWPAKDLGGGACRFSEPFKKIPLIANAYPDITTGLRPASLVTATDTFVIERLTQAFLGACTVQGADPNVTPGNNVAFQDLDLNRVVATSKIMVLGAGFTRVFFWECLLRADFNGQSITGDTFMENSALRRTLQGTGGTYHLNAGLIVGPVQFGAQLILMDFDLMIQGFGFGLFNGAVKIGTVCSFDCTIANARNNPTGDGIHIGPGASAQFLTFNDGTHALWGSGNQGAGVGVQSNGVLGFQTNAPTITGSTPGTNDFTLSLATSSRTWDETANAGAGGWSAALITNSWANLVAALPGGLNNAATNVSTGARISKGI